MATTEERLAALETKLAALTETTPTTYYEHQYSGEEIDAAVGRALTGGALDTSVTNVSNQLGTFVRPNLLDNWYFGNPVDQRKGYIQIGGTMMYKDAACTDQFGPSAGTTPVVVYATYARPIDHGVELALYIPLNNIVRGYMGNGYAVDRWYFDADSGSCSLTLTNDGLKFIATASATGIASLKQDIDPTMLSALAGKTVTLSLLGKTDITQQVLFYVNSKVAAVNFSQAVNGVCMTTLTYTFPEVLTGAAIFAYGRSHSGAGEGTIIAAKLELGPTQTLAHQENGAWVMNEVPEYGEQLRRCQRYFERTAWAVCLAVATTTTTIEFCGSYYFKSEKRVPPVITVSTPSQAATIYDTVANVYYTDVEVQQPTAYSTKMMAPKIYDSKGRFVIGRIYQVIVGDGQYLVSADL